MTAALGQRWDEAEAHYRETLRLADEIRDRIEQPEVRRLYAQRLQNGTSPVSPLREDRKGCSIFAER